MTIFIKKIKLIKIDFNQRLKSSWFYPPIEAVHKLHHDEPEGKGRFKRKKEISGIFHKEGGGGIG